MAEWSELTELTRGRSMVIERVRIKDSKVAIEGEFELPPLAQLSYEDQVFVAAFVKSHGSIKEMEGIFGVSYPTIKGRLNRIGEAMTFVNIEIKEDSDRQSIINSLEKREISVEEAVERLKRC